ncbi:Pentapeptide repeat [Calothrix sp. PCC 7716]|nr:Pentapeptide repeat [Calothrix sp. PCC 7716]
MSPIDLLNLIQAIAGAASPVLKDKIQRNETVIRILQQFDLAPDHPPSDFSGIYAYALVEYGIGKPLLLLELFRDEEIKKAFRKAFDNNNPSIILSEINNYLDTYARSNKIKSLGIDARREVAAFYLVFCKVAKTSREPSDVLLSQQITALQQKLDRLPTLEGICTEIARLVAQNNLALQPGTNAAPENQCKAIALAQQMRGWFETLGYRFEQYEIWGADYFEWVITIQIWRHRYERFVIRGIAGEAQVKDVIALRQSVLAQRTDGGWLVTARRISRAARAEVEKDKNKLACYTFDELLAQDADFSGYLEWLEAEIKRRQIDTKYVPLACTKEEIDSATGRQIAVSHYGEEDGWIDGYIDRWLDDPAKEHISVLGEFGTGKTWFAFHYAWIALQRYRGALNRGVELPRLPLVIPLRDYAKAVSVESLFSEFFFRQYKIPLPHYDAFVQLNRMGKLLLIFDGFDEMAARVDRQEMINNFWELAKVVVPGAKVILTCRSEHFPEAKEGRALLNAELQASIANLTGETPQFEVLELEKFSDEQIKQVLSCQASEATVEHVMSNPQLLDLARRPVMTDLILEALPDIEAGKPVDMSRVYLYAVRHKMETDIKTERTFTSLADKLYFLCELSWEMLSTDQMSLNYRVFPDRIRRLFATAVQEEKDLDHWQFDMMGQTMLIRNADGDYTPAHRSLLEFFVAYKFAAEIGALADDFTELARSQEKMEAPIPYTWSSYFGEDAVAPLDKFVSEPLEKLRETFGKAPLSKAVLELLAPMVGDVESVVGVIQGTRDFTEDEVGYVGGNAATLVVKVDKTAFLEKDLTGTVIKKADFSNASLQHVNFTSSHLNNCTFAKTLSRISSLACTPDGKILVTGSDDGAVCLWEVASGREILTINKEHFYWVNSVAISPNGKIIASAGEKTVKLLSIGTGELLKIFFSHSDNVTDVTFAPNGKIIISSCYDGTINFWNIEQSKCIKTFIAHSAAVQTVVFSPSNEILASCSNDKTVKLWDIQSDDCLKVLIGHESNIRSVAYSPDGELLASCSEDKTIRLWNVNNGECLKIFQGHEDIVSSVVFSPDGKILVSSSDDETIRLWNIKSGECLKILHGHKKWISSITFIGDSELLASSSGDQTIRIWDIGTRECIRVIQGYRNWVRSVAFSPDGKILASGNGDQTIKFWDIYSEKCIKTISAHKGWLFSVAFSPNGKMLASSAGDREAIVKIWDVATGKCINTFYGHKGWIRCVVFSPDGKILASASEDNTIKLWCINNRECIKTLNQHIDSVFSITFSPDGTRLASASADNDKTIRLWDTESGKCIKVLQEHTRWVSSVAFNCDGKILASGSGDGTIKLWDINTGKCLQTLTEHRYYIRSVAFSSDGKMLASGCRDRTIKLWDVYTGNCIKTLEGHSYWVNSVAFSPDDKLIASGSHDETIKFWDAETGECLKSLRNERPYENMNITGATGLTSIEKATLKALGAVEDEVVE